MTAPAPLRAPPGRSAIRILGSTPSTNDEALAWGRRGAADGACVAADEQTAGRGRRGRGWHSPPGRNLYASLVVRCAAQSAGLLALLGALVVRDTVAAMLDADARARIKWPNDVLIDGRKVAGVLAEWVSGPPAFGVVVWLLKIGPDAALNLTPVLFLPHVALDTYAFVGNDMFEYLPATRRAAEQSAIDALGTPVVVLDERGRVVDANDAAGTLFPGGTGTARTRHVAAALDAEVDPEGGPQRLSLSRGGRTREFRITPARLEDSGGGHVGYTLVFQDVTEAVRREQRLSVLNRVLRHNLRNDLSVAMGYVEVSADRVEDEAVREMLESAEGTLENLVTTGEKARLVEETVRRAGADPEPVDLGALVGDTADALGSDYPAATVAVDSSDVTVTTNRALVAAVLEELVENACEHGGGEVTVSVSQVHEDGGEGQDDRGGATLTVADSGPGIPQQELETLGGEEETDLRHGSGLGLWVVRWGTELLGADLTFETGADGTTATVRLPDRGADGAD